MLSDQVAIPIHILATLVPCEHTVLVRLMHRKNYPSCLLSILTRRSCIYQIGKSVLRNDVEQVVVVERAPNHQIGNLVPVVGRLREDEVILIITSTTRTHQSVLAEKNSLRRSPLDVAVVLLHIR